MIHILGNIPVRRSLFIALLCAIGLTFLISSVASAQTIRPDPQMLKAAILHTANVPVQTVFNTGYTLVAHATSGSAPGELDGPTLFNALMVTLVELGAIFWVGAQFWLNFVLQPLAEKRVEERDLNSQVELRFERRFSLPTLGLLLLASLGALYGQALPRTNNDWAAAFNWPLLSELVSSGRFGTYWLIRVGILLLAFLLGLYMLLSRERPRAIQAALPLINLFLGAMLFIAITLSGHATAVASIIVPYSVVLDWLHLMAAALWIGGMIYLLLVYLPLLRARALSECARSLLAILSQYTPLAIAGVILMAITGPLNASFHLTSLDQFTTTAYGRTLLVKIFLVGVLLISSAYHLGWLRPRLQKEYQKYIYARTRLEKAQADVADNEFGLENQPGGSKLLIQQVKLREGRLVKKTTSMTRILSWEPWFGVAVILCVGLLSVFGGTLTQAPVQPGSSNRAVAGPFNGTAKTSDGKYSVTLNISPNRFGTNVFSAQVTEIATGKSLVANDARVTIYTTMLDMNMGTDSTELRFNDKGTFSANADFSMGGNWSIKVQVRTADNTLHEASFKIYTPF
jgi:copper transport protein